MVVVVDNWKKGNGKAIFRNKKEIHGTTGHSAFQGASRKLWGKHSKDIKNKLWKKLVGIY